MARLEQHDSARDIEARILAALRAAGLNPEQRLSPVELGALDHFHTGGFHASRVLLNRLTGLDDRIDVHEGSALDLPFPDASFDAVWMQNVGMNIADKRTLYAEVYRVLKPGGRFAFQEMTAGEAPTTYFPLPWASDPGYNFLKSADEMRSVLGESGFITEGRERAAQSSRRSDPLFQGRLPD